MIDTWIKLKAPYIPEFEKDVLVQSTSSNGFIEFDIAQLDKIIEKVDGFTYIFESKDRCELHHVSHWQYLNPAENTNPKEE